MVNPYGRTPFDPLAQTSKRRNRTQLLGATYQAATARWGICSSRLLIILNARLLFLPPARVGYLRAGARVVSHEAFKLFSQILGIGRVLSTQLSAIRSAAAQRQPMDVRMADGVLRWEGQGIGCREAGELNAELCIYLVRLHPNIARRRGSLWLAFSARAKVHRPSSRSRT